MIRTLKTSGLLALALLTVCPQAFAQNKPQPYFSPNGGGAEATAALIDATTSTLDVAMYSISPGPSNPIWGALQRAVQRGVKVRLILNEATGANKSKAAALQGIGVHVYGVSKTLHEKFAIFDNRKLVNGSANWSLGAMTKYSENTTVFGAHPRLVYEFQVEFNRLLARARAVSPGAESHMQPIVVTPPSPFASKSVLGFFTSTNTNGTAVVGDKIIEVLRTAQRSVIIDVAHFNSKSIADALIQLHRDRPQVRMEVLLDLGEFGDPKSRCKELERAGIEVRYKTYSLAYLQPRAQLMHHKTMIIDETRVVTGSFNWSDTAENGNYENVLVIEGRYSANRACVGAYLAEHRKLWELNRAIYPRFRDVLLAAPGSPDYRRVFPVHFDTPYHDTIMTLSRAELAPLRARAFADGLLERVGNKTKVRNDATYIDRETRAPLVGPAPTGKFLDGAGTTATTPTPGLSGALPGQ